MSIRNVAIGISLLLAACMPLPADPSGQNTSSSLPTETDALIPIELPPEESSSSVMTGTGALAERFVEHGILEIGEEDAPVTLMVFTNYSCAYCAQFMRDVLPKMEQEFLATGDLKVRILPAPLKKYPNSALEAAALTCGAVLARGQVINAALTDAATRDRKFLMTLPKQLDIPAADFTKCLDAPETKALVEQQRIFAESHGVTLLPTFMVVGHDDPPLSSSAKSIVGLPSYADLRGWLNAAIRDE